MKKSTYTTQIDGQTFTRTTARTYTHIVLVTGTLDASIERALASVVYDRKNNRAYHQGIANATAGELAQYGGTQAQVDHSIAWIAKTDAEAMDAAMTKTIEAWYEQNRSQGLPTTQSRRWFEVGYAGRADLAAKMANKPGHRAVALEPRA